MEGSFIMKSLIKKGVLVCICALLVSSIPWVPALRHVAQAAGPESLLSGNTLNTLIPTGTPTIATGATYSWLQEGTHATNSEIVTTDLNGALDMTDGLNGPDGNYSNNSSWQPNTPAFGNLVFDLKSVYKVSKVKLWADTGNNAYMSKVEVMVSMDGLNYNSAGIIENTNALNSGFAAVTFALKPAFYGRYVKVIMHKDQAKPIMRLGEVAVFGEQLDQPSLLSNNFLKPTGPYNTSVPFINTGAAYQWVTEQPFVTQQDLILYDNDSSKNDGAGGAPDLTDGSSTEAAGDMTTNSAWGSYGKYGTVLFNLNNMYQIGKIDVWTRVDSSKFMDGYEVQVSTDGVNYTSLGYTANPNSRTSNAIVNTESLGVSGQHAKYVKIIMHNANDSQQLTVGEIAIWGWELYDTDLSVNPVAEQVEIQAKLKNYSNLFVDWSSYNSVVNQVNKYALYIETSNFTTTVGLTPKYVAETNYIAQIGKFYNYFALNPDTTYYVAVTPFRAGGSERTDVTPLKVRTPSILGGEKVGDVFAVNDAPYGGGNYVNHGAGEEANLTNKLNLLREIGAINKNRWWDHAAHMKDKYGKYGLNFHMYYHGPSDVAGDNAKGAWSFSTANEPDLKGTNPAAYATSIGLNYASLKAASANSLLVEPALGGVEPSSLSWLHDFYNSDGQNGALVKTYFDVMDVHPYVKKSDTPYPGLALGAPEMLISKIADLKAAMTSHGDGSKPIVFTEIGWSNYTGVTHMQPVDTRTQRNYLPRAYMHAIANGIKTVYWYNFQDDGTNPANMEHNFGLIDWNGVPKPAYYGYYTMARVLKDSRYVGAVSSISNPHYGYKFWDETKNRYITALWDASWTTASTMAKTLTLSTTDTSVTVVGIDGSYKSLVANAGAVSLPLTGAPVFIYSNHSVSVTSIN
jgi:hypothetical protein